MGVPLPPMTLKTANGLSRAASYTSSPPGSAVPCSRSASARASSSGGLVLALACDYRLGVDGDYRIGLNEVAIGASYPKVAFEVVRQLRCLTVGGELDPHLPGCVAVLDLLFLPGLFARLARPALLLLQPALDLGDPCLDVVVRELGLDDLPGPVGLGRG